MIAETMAGIALVKGAVDGIKSIISTANDVSDIAGYVINCLRARNKYNKPETRRLVVDLEDHLG